MPSRKALFPFAWAVSEATRKRCQRQAAGPSSSTGTNERAKAAKCLELAYIGVANHHRDKVINFFNLHDGRAGLQMLVNLPNVPGGGIAEDCFPNGTSFTAAADAKNDLITVSIPVYDKGGAGHVLTFIYGKAGETWGWMVKDWLDERPGSRAEDDRRVEGAKR